jgi:hypothetical protein
MTIYYTEEDFESYYKQYVRRDTTGQPLEDEEEFWERKLKEPEEFC